MPGNDQHAQELGRLFDYGNYKHIEDGQLADKDWLQERGGQDTQYPAVKEAQGGRGERELAPVAPLVQKDDKRDRHQETPDHDHRWKQVGIPGQYQDQDSRKKEKQAGHKHPQPG